MFLKGQLNENQAHSIRTLKIAKLLSADVMLHLDPITHQAPNITNKLKRQLRVPPSSKPEFKAFLTYESYGETDSNKFHYFAVYELPDGTWIGGNAWGRIGYMQTGGATVIAKGDYRSVMAKVKAKIASKLAKGYVEAKFVAK